MIYGTAELVDCTSLSLKEYQASKHYHCIPEEITANAPYKTIHAGYCKIPYYMMNQCLISIRRELSSG